MVPTEDTMDPRRRFGRRPTRSSTGSTPDWPAAEGAPVPGRLLIVEDRCWQCRSKVRAIVGALVDHTRPSDKNGFLPYDAIGPQLAAPRDPSTLNARRIGPLKHRESPGRP